MRPTLDIRGMWQGLAIAAVMIAASSLPAGAQTYVLDKGHTDIRFSWNHAGVSDQSGRFNAFDGELVLDAEDPTKSKLDVTIKTESISTGVVKLDEHLRSADFFEAAKFPEVTFKSTGIQRISAEGAIVTGDLTIKNVTKPTTLDVKLVHQGEHPLGQFIDYYKGQWLGFKAETTILRSEYGVGLYAPLTSDRIAITINTEMKAK